MKPEPFEIGDDQITERQAWNSLQQIRKTTTGPDGIPYTVWKDHAEPFSPVFTMVWNLSRKTHTWPRALKMSNIILLPEVDIPNEKTDYRGINVTSVIARAFEKIVLRVHARAIMEEHPSPTQFVYWEGGSCTNALLPIQQKVNQFLDTAECKTVLLFAIDFSKVFDTVNTTFCHRN